MIVEGILADPYCRQLHYNSTFTSSFNFVLFFGESSTVIFSFPNIVPIEDILYSVWESRASYTQGI
jgi:hypothetical protein